MVAVIPDSVGMRRWSVIPPRASSSRICPLSIGRGDRLDAVRGDHRYGRLFVIVTYHIAQLLRVVSIA